MVVIIAVDMTALAALSAETSYDSTKTLSIQGGYGKVLSLDIEEIASQTQAYLNGMPFDIESEQVHYGKTENGRLIANWTVLSNSEFEVQISSEKLTSVGTDASGNHVGLDFILHFNYNMAYYDKNGDIASVSTTFFDFDTTGNNSKTVNLLEGITPDIDSYYVGSVSGSIFFMFTQASTDKIVNEPESVPSGEYKAITTITLIPN